MSRGPIIGITPSYEYEPNRMVLRTDYYNGIIEGGGIPIILPTTDSESCIEEYLELCDGFLISGGPDIDALYYGEENLKFIGGICPERDSMEIKFAREAIAADKPVLGICRGCQVINVAMGGTLFQDIHSQMDKTLIRHQQDAPRWHASHSIKIEKPSVIYDIFGEEKIIVNSYHHQAIKVLADNFRATAFAPDGVVEAIEHMKKKFVVGTQWHPENMWQRHPIFLKLFRYFVEKCK